MGPEFSESRVFLVAASRQAVGTAILWGAACGLLLLFAACEQSAFLARGEREEAVASDPYPYVVDEDLMIEEPVINGAPLPMDSEFHPGDYVLMSVLVDPEAMIEGLPTARFYRGLVAADEFEFKAETVEQWMDEIARYVQETWESDPSLLGVAIYAEGEVKMRDIEAMKAAIYRWPLAHGLRLWVICEGDSD